MRELAALGDVDPRVAAAAQQTALGRTVRSTTLWVAVALLAIILLFGALSDGVFLRADNISDMAVNSVIAVILAVGATFILGAGLLDLSIGSSLLLCSIVSAKVTTALAGSAEEVAAGVYPNLALGIAGGVAAGIACGALLGAVNGLIVTRLKLNSFIVTLATMGIFNGIALIVTNGVNVPNVPQQLQTDFAGSKLAGIPLPVFLAAIVAAAMWFVLTKTRFGMRTLAIGSSEEAARRANVPVDRHIVSLFVLMGVLAGIAGIVDLARFGTTNLEGHQTDALAAFAATVIGGTSLFGGRASVGGAVLGALIPVVLATGLVILDVVSFYQLVVVGVILILAVWLDQLRRSRFN
ncbi:ribose transport system permease protein [Conexibacter arvalis]|uniref:Ribose transport system permease protein n=1 Tax=Conexibacter arvalis TaxID=912552 RepID=A0A840IEP9_9ACTN|nr:ribose transport system permease protein [Conexibacter arvalis]